MCRTASRTLVMLVLASVVILGSSLSCQRAASAAARPSATDVVARGHYLVEIAGCGDCHTPLKLGPNGPEPDISRALSGHPEDFVVSAPPALGGGWMWAGSATNTAFAGPWGISYAPNLTPDQETGLGIWTEEMFVKAIREGKQYGNGRPLNPPMPWPAYSHLTDDDLKAMFAYLKTVKPVVNHVPDWLPPAG